MVDYITKAELRSFASEIPITEQRVLRKSAGEQSPAGSTFLSHSSKDSDLVTGAIRVLQGHGAIVYIDEIDPSMPPYTSTETANKLKDRIQICRRFVLLASDNSKDSRWVPWELGIADGYKGISRVALFPAVETAATTSWTSWEYLGLYNRIVWGRIEGRENSMWMVLDERKNTASPLSDWLTG